MPFIYHHTPIGIALISEEGGFVNAIKMLEKEAEPQDIASPVLSRAALQLDEYFAGKRQVFDFGLKQPGTAFQQQVWATLLQIAYGQTISYAQQSQWMKSPLAIRAIAAANGKNHVGIVVPCHRVIGTDGSLTGYASGLWRKKWLLEHEAKVLGIGQLKLGF